MRITPFNLLCVSLTLIFALGKAAGALQEWSWWLVFTPALFWLGTIALAFCLMASLVASGRGSFTIERINGKHTTEDDTDDEEASSAWDSKQQPRQHRAEPEGKVGGNEPGSEQ